MYLARSFLKNVSLTTALPMAAAGLMKNAVMARQRAIVAYDGLSAQPLKDVSFTYISRRQQYHSHVTCCAAHKRKKKYWTSTVALRDRLPEQRCDSKNADEQTCQETCTLHTVIQVLSNVAKRGLIGGRCESGHHGVKCDKHQIDNLLGIC